MAAVTTEKEQARALDLKAAAEGFVSSLRALQAVRAANVADALVITDAALSAAGPIAHMTAADVVAAMASIDALPAELGGHLTNITKIAGR
jgi:hypothetical protein